jgi:small subunit ribosomal protein S6
MPETRVYLYEGMFLFNPAAIASNIATATQVVHEMLRRAEAEVLSVAKWDDRKLAYPVEGQKRGLYMIAYFRARGTQIPNIERDVNLSEQVLRCMMLRADHIGDVELELAIENQKQTQAAIALEGQRSAEAEARAAATAAAAPAPAPAAAAAATAVEEAPQAPEPDQAPDAADQESEA